MKIRVESHNAIESKHTLVKLRCPQCKQRGTFDQLQGHDVQITFEGNRFVTGQRICPDPDCYSHLFFVKDNNEIISYPVELLDFDSTNIPDKVLKAFEEGLSCHANQNYIASAIMVRKTMEELCIDQQAEGDNLKKRIADLGTKIVIPRELLTGIDDLRLLGNDAAHIESQVYDKIGPEEVEIAIEVTKEILKAVYQLSALTAKLEQLKKANEEPQT